MKWEITTKPTTKIFGWDKLRPHLRVDDPDERDYVLELEDECTSYAEEKMERSLIARTITATFWAEDVSDAPPILPMVNYAAQPYRCRQALHLPRGPVASITSVKDSNNNDIDYTLERVGNSDRVRLTPTSVNYPVTVVYVAGHASVEDVPADIKGAIRTHIATRYAIREAVHEGALTPVTNLDEFYRLRGRGSPVQ
jgi:hypothetical protein